MQSWEGLGRIPVSRWAQAPQEADLDKVPRDHKLDALPTGPYCLSILLSPGEPG